MEKIICILFAILIFSTEKTLSTEIWELNSNYQSTYFCDIDSYDSLNIIAVGHVSTDRARAYYTSDGGKLWEQILPDSAIYQDPTNRIGGSVANSVSCKYENLWLVGCDKNLIIRTTDKGKTWKRIYINTRDSVILGIKMANTNVGYCRTWYSIFKTTDGGLSWNKIILPKFNNPNNMRRIVNIEVAEYNKVMIHYWFDMKRQNFISKDGCLSWEEMILDTNQEYACFNFVNEHNGWALTQYFIPGPFLATKIWKTNDGGSNWNLIYDSKDSGVAFEMQSILFLDNVKGFIYRDKFVYRTNDGGYSWEKDEIQNVDINNSDFAIKRVFFVNKNKGFLINKRDRIYEYDYNSVSVNELNFGDLSISPNPAGDFITVTLKPSEGFELSEGSEVHIYNTLGEKVIDVGAENFLPLQINISALSKGIYFVKIGGETAKLVKL